MSRAPAGTRGIGCLLGVLALLPADDARAGSARIDVIDQGRELGTSYEVRIVVPIERRAGAEIDLDSVRALTTELEARLSEWRTDSEISRVNRDAGAGPVPVGEDLLRVLRGAEHVWRVTGGAFDPTWRALARLWDEAEAAGEWPGEAALANALDHVGFLYVALGERSVRFRREGVVLGIAGVAKGWIIDSIFHRLRALGYDDVLVNIGGDLRVSGTGPDGTPRVFSVLDPENPSRVIAEIPATDTAVATSGNYLRVREIAGRRVGHVLDPRTGLPPAFEGSVTVLARDAAMADALATGLFVLGPEEGLALVESLDGADALYALEGGVRSSSGIRVERLELSRAR